MFASALLLILLTSYALNLNIEIGNSSMSENINNSSVEIEVTNFPKSRKPVKLNTKQNFAMKQVIATYSLINAKDELCKNHSLEFQEALKAFEPWALQMFDASSKLQAGVLAGNLMEFGSFKQCLNVYSESKYGPIRGRQCLVKVQPSTSLLKKILSFRNITERRFETVKSTMEGASLKWSICIPDSCNHEDLLTHINKTILGFTEGLDVEVSVDEIDCDALIDTKPFNEKELTFFGLIVALVTVVLLTTFKDVLDRRRKQARSNFVKIFSAYSNTLYIIARKEEKSELDCLHGMRSISMLYVIIGHRFLMTLFYPSVNSLDVLDWLLEYPSTTIIGGTVSVDSFFLMSGLLVSYLFFDHVSKGRKFNLFLFYLHRYLRITPSYAVVVMIIAVFSPRFGSGPIWKRNLLDVQKPCQNYWWAALLYIQSYTNPRHTCVLQTWYLACDMQYYFFSPLILVPLWKSRKLGIINLVLFFLVSMGVNFHLAWKNKYRAGMMIDNNLGSSDYFAYHYITPYVRASPYIIGLAYGYFLHLVKGQSYKMNFLTLVSGWMMSFAIMGIVILSNQRFQRENFVYNKLESSIFLSMTRSAWVFSLMWIIWACRNGYGGPVNSFLSSYGFQVMGKIAYSMYLIHMQFQYLYSGSTKQPIYFSNIDSIHKAFGDIGLSAVGGYFLTILVECPCVRLSTLYFKKGFLSISTIHGFNHIAERNRHPIEVLIWFSLICLGLYGAFILSGLTLNRYQENPTVISMERDRFSFNTSFPTATICPLNKINEAVFETYIAKSTVKNKTGLRSFIESLAPASFENFEDVVEYDEISPDEYMKILDEILFDFKPSVSNSGINGQQYQLKKVITEMGICYTFNSQLSIYNSPQYRYRNLWGLVDNEKVFFVNPLDGEVFANVVNMSTGFTMFLHGTYEVADVASKALNSPNGYFLQVYLTALSLYSSGRARGLTPQQRKCRFYDESNLRHSPVYSFVLCRMECRINLAKKLCGCIPHFYRKLEGEKYCDVAGLHCLSRHKERVISLKKECTCLPNCDEVNYIIEHVDSREWFLGSNLQWGLKEYPRMRLKRDVLFGFADLLVYIGGMAGLFFGCSLLSFMEIVYFFTLRLFWFVVRYEKVSDKDKPRKILTEKPTFLKY